MTAVASSCRARERAVFDAYSLTSLSRLMFPLRGGPEMAPTPPTTLLTLYSRGLTRPPLRRLPRQRLDPLSAKAVGFRYLDRAKPHGLPGLDLPDATDVERADGRDLRV